MLEEFENIGLEALERLKSVSDSSQLEEFRVEYLGRKGKVTSMLSRIGQLPPEQRRRVVIETARRLVPLGADILKAEFPVDVSIEPDENIWRDACEEFVLERHPGAVWLVRHPNDDPKIVGVWI